MTKRLFSIALIAAAVVLPMSLPVQGGRFSSYDSTWTMLCSPTGSTPNGGSASGTLALTTRKGTLKSTTAACTVSGSVSTTSADTLNTTTAPTNWTWTSSDCYDGGVSGAPLLSRSGKVGQTWTYNCFKGGISVTTGTIGVGLPVGLK